MEAGKLNAQVRSTTGSSAVRKLRAQGKIPAICYGSGVDPVALVLDPSDPGGKPISALATMPGGFLSVAMSGDGSRVVAGSTAGAVVIWDRVTRRELGVLPVGATPVYSLRFSDDETLVVATGEGIRMLSTGRK